jgi:hypothetical protein
MGRGEAGAKEIRGGQGEDGSEARRYRGKRVDLSFVWFI